MHSVLSAGKNKYTLEMQPTALIALYNYSIRVCSAFYMDSEESGSRETFVTLS